MTSDAKTADTTRHTHGGPTAWSRYAWGVLEFAESRGADRREVLAELAIEDAVLRDPDGRVELDAFYTLVERAAEATDPALFAIEFARQISLETFDAVGFLMATSPTLGDAFERGLACQRLWSEGERYELVVRDGIAAVRFTPYGSPRRAHRLCAEMALFDIGLNSAVLCGRPLPLERLRLRTPGPLDVEDYQSMIGCEVELRAPIDELQFTAEALAWELVDANEAMSAFFERYTRRQLDALPENTRMSERVRALVGQHLERGPPTLDELATRLHMSRRTLQRRLRAEETSLHDLIDAVRRERAVAFLDTRMAIAEIAYLLGYSEPSAFHRAFKRWTGHSPRR